MASKIPKLVVALDIGTTHSGYAWQSRDDFESNPSKVGLYNWKAGLIKTSTAILFSNFKEKVVDSIGFVAEERYAEHGAKPKNNDWRLFKHFKMVLYGEQFSENTIVEDVESVEHASIKCVMTEFIKELKNHFIEDSKRKGQDVLPDEDIRWVVTVPAIWNDGARNFMKQCAEAAMESSSPNDTHKQFPNVLIALEPEAAAIYCLHLSAEERHAMGGLGKTGDSFLLADLGGGTADVSVQKVADDGKFEQLCVPNGERCGGEDINNAFFLACKDEFRGNSWSEAWQSLSQEQILKADHRLRQDFEMRKVEILRDTSPADEWVRFRLPRPLENLLNDGPLRLKENGKVFKIDEGELYFNGKLVRETLFKTTASNIFSILKKVLKKDNVKNIEKVVLVGGLSESGIVLDNMKHRLKETFKQRNIAVYVPKLPMKAVLTGAVLFGHDLKNK